MKIISNPISRNKILENYNSFFRKMIKAVVDIDKQIIALDAELHADLEELLLENGSKQKNLWGINLYLEKEKDKRIEYTALINIRPSLDNRSMEIEDLQIRNKINKIVNRLITI
ncbi:MAG: hypothetical protein KAW92_14120 [Candidatus Cloacimonetes bacterium]|nr:hypothetical protein [Candidatus Cloacimonadota bacterium]